MAADLSFFTSNMMSWVVNPLIWLAVFGGGMLIVFGFLYIKKKRKLIYPAAEVTNIGGGKTNLNFLGKGGAGWYGEKTYAWSLGLIDYGNQVLKISDGSIVHNFCEEDFQEINGSRAVLFYRDPNNRKLFPVSFLKVENGDITATIAPDDYVSTSANLLAAAEEETKKSWEKAAPYLITAAAIIFALIALIVIAQLMKGINDASLAAAKDSGAACLEVAKSACSEMIKSFTLPPASGAP